MTFSHTLTPLSDPIASSIRQDLLTYWKAIAQLEDLEGALGELVRETEVKVTELLQSNEACDVYEASRITAAFEFQRQLHSAN